MAAVAAIAPWREVLVSRLFIPVTVALSLLVAPLGAEPLEFGKTIEIVIPGGEVKDFELNVEAAGMLTAVTRGSGGDCVLAVCDSDNQPLPDGQADVDVAGNLSDEQLVSAIPYAETWRVRVRNNSEEVAKVQLVVGFVAFAPAQREPDPDGRPSRAVELEVGTVMTDRLSYPDYDLSDWLMVTAADNGRLIFFTEGDDALDLVLMVFTGEEFDQVIAHSDQDLESSTANEGLIVPVKAGQVYYLQVSCLAPSAGSYRLGSQFAAF